MTTATIYQFLQKINKIYYTVHLLLLLLSLSANLKLIGQRFHCFQAAAAATFCNCWQHWSSTKRT